MIVPKVALTDFQTFMWASFGVQIQLKRVHDEYGRFMYRGRFFVIRDTAEEPGEVVEVHSSDRQLLEDLERTWTVYFLNRSKEDDKSDHGKRV